MQNKNKILGVDIGGTKIHMGEVSNGKVLRDLKFSTSASAPKEQILQEVIDGISQLMTPETLGIGIGVPGLVDEERGIVYNVQNIPSWEKIHLKSQLEKHFDKPVFIANDANAFVAGEKIYGKGKEFKNFVGITLGTGIGTGIIINNAIYSGSFLGAGEYGGIPYLDKTIEDYSSGKFFKKFGVSSKKLLLLAEQGDTNALEIFNQYGNHFGNALKIILYSISPEAILLGGSVSNCYQYFRDAMFNSLKEFPYEVITNNLVVERSSISGASILGSVALFQMRFEQENAARIKNL
jgi:glucokinase